MEVEWNYPKFKYKENPPAIYRMDFDTGHFYIGSSKQIKTRINGWRTVFKNNRFSSKILADALKNVTVVNLTIIEHPSLEILHERETYYLNLYFNDHMCVNRSPSGFDNTGLKPLPAHLVKPKKIKVPKPPKPKKPRKFKPPPADYVWAFSKGVVQFNIDGSYVQSHKSIADAARAVCVKAKILQDHLNVKRHKTGLKGFIFKLCGDNSPIELLVRKPYQPKGTNSHWRPVINTVTGEVFPNSAIVAKMENMKSATYFWKQLNGHKPNPTQYRYV